MKIREEDNGMDDDGKRAIGDMRKFTFTQMNKFTWWLIGIMASVIGFVSVHWFTVMEAKMLNDDQKFIDTLKQSEDYTDKAMSQHIKEQKADWDTFYEMKKVTQDTNNEVQRISNFMEFKFGMPEKKQHKK